MAKRHGGSRRSAPAPGSSPSVELARLRGAFVAWLREHGLPAGADESLMWDDVDAVVAVAVDRAALTDVRLWTPEQIDTLTAAIEEDRQAPDQQAPLLALSVLLAFLGDTGRWSGTPEQLQAALEATSPMSRVVAALAKVQVDPATEDAALRELPVIAQVEALIRFLSPRRPLTGSGGLRRADIRTAAELLGIDLAGKTPRSMWDVPRLALLWGAAEAADLLAVTGREVTPAPVAQGWLSSDADAGRQARRRLAVGYLSHLLTTPPEFPWLGDPREPMLVALARSALGQAAPTASVLGGRPAAPGDDVDAGILSTSFVIQVIRQFLDTLTTDGLVQVSDKIAVAPGLRGVVAEAVASALRAEQESGLSPQLPPPDPSLAGQAWRLRVELENAQPRVWREVLVDPDIPLDELHEVIQRLFAWYGYHLHDFTAPGPGRRQTRRFAPPDLDDDWSGIGMPETTDEASVRLSSLIGPRRGWLRYTYDFGDDWEHRITVVSSGPAGDTPLLRCVAGAGAAPREDSGGVWGWAEMIETARDPSDPEHAEMREWLGLEDGETLDPTAFDLDVVNKRLSALRRRQPSRD